MQARLVSLQSFFAYFHVINERMLMRKNREFPSLSDAPQQNQQPQQNTQGQSLWSNPSLRAPQQQPLSRGTLGQGSQQQQLQRQITAPGSQNEARDDNPPFGQGSDDFHFGNQGNLGQLAGMSQPQTGNIDEFPPLGGLGNGADPQQERASLLSGSGFGGGLGPGNRMENNLGQTSGLAQARNSILNSGGRADRSTTTFGSMQLSPSGNSNNAASSTRREGGYLQQLTGIPLALEQRYSGDAQASSASNSLQRAPGGHKRLSEMTSMEYYGLPGLLARIPTTSPDHNPFVIGHDLTTLGFDLNRTDGEPLYKYMSVPFDDASGNPPRPAIPEFSLPASYNVTNVPPILSKMGQMAEETLLYIFYMEVRDLKQELAAEELFKRDWRWNTKTKEWIQKDLSIMRPEPLNDKSERGFYFYWDTASWSKRSVSFISFRYALIKFGLF
jgi:CCR4-NOT transcription complex subunit 2